MRLVVGLGNPGLAYTGTRHNVGFMVLDRLARRQGISLSRRRFRARFGEGTFCGTQVVLAKPYAYMNMSGPPVRNLLSFCRLSLHELIVIHDDLDVPFGLIRIRRKGGHGGHRGIASLIEALGDSDFERVKVGIGRPPGSLDVTGYVLDSFAASEKARLERILLKAVDAVETILDEGIDRAMNIFNEGEPVKNRAN